jgi:hypothetical protein
MEQIPGPLAHTANDFFQEQFVFKPGDPIRILHALKRIEILKRSHILHGWLPGSASIEPMRCHPKHIIIDISDSVPKSRMAIKERGKRVDCAF